MSGMLLVCCAAAQYIPAGAVFPTAALIPTSNLIFWYSADCITVAPCGTPSNGANVTAWADRSATGLNLVINSGSTCTFNTAQINGQPAVLGSVCSFNMGASTTGPFSAQTAFAVFQRSGSGKFALMSGNNVSGGFKWWTGATKEQGADSYCSAQLGTGTANIDTNWHQMNIVQTTSAETFRLDRAGDGTGSGATFTNYVNVIGRGGCGGGGEILNGSLAELIYYSSALSGADITTVETYLNGKYGL